MRAASVSLARHRKDAGGIRMTLRRWAIALMLVCGAGVWAVAHTASDSDPAPVSAAEGDNARDEAEARYRSGQSNHWRHVVVGNHASAR